MLKSIVFHHLTSKYTIYVHVCRQCKQCVNTHVHVCLYRLDGVNDYDLTNSPFFLDGFCFLELVLPSFIEFSNQSLCLLEFLHSCDLLFRSKAFSTCPSNSTSSFKDRRTKTYKVGRDARVCVWGGGGGGGGWWWGWGATE